MIYGINFNGVPIPDEALKLFSTNIRLSGEKFYLHGVCQTNEEAESMRLQAERPGRKVHFVPRVTKGWIGVFCS